MDFYEKQHGVEGGQPGAGGSHTQPTFFGVSLRLDELGSFRDHARRWRDLAPVVCRNPCHAQLEMGSSEPS